MGVFYTYNKYFVPTAMLLPYFSNSGRLLGRLTIVANAQAQCGCDSNLKSTHTLTNNEANLLRTLKNLKEKSTCYKYRVCIQSANIFTRYMKK